MWDAVLAAGRWPLAAGRWPLAAGQLYTRLSRADVKCRFAGRVNGPDPEGGAASPSIVDVPCAAADAVIPDTRNMVVPPLIAGTTPDPRLVPGTAMLSTRPVEPFLLSG